MLVAGFDHAATDLPPGADIELERLHAPRRHVRDEGVHIGGRRQVPADIGMPGRVAVDEEAAPEKVRRDLRVVLGVAFDEALSRDVVSRAPDRRDPVSEVEGKDLVSGHVRLVEDVGDVDVRVDEPGQDEESGPVDARRARGGVGIRVQLGAGGDGFDPAGPDEDARVRAHGAGPDVEDAGPVDEQGGSRHRSGLVAGRRRRCRPPVVRIAAECKTGAGQRGAPHEVAAIDGGHGWLRGDEAAQERHF